MNDEIGEVRWIGRDIGNSVGIWKEGIIKDSYLGIVSADASCLSMTASYCSVLSCDHHSSSLYFLLAPVMLRHEASKII